MNGWSSDRIKELEKEASKIVGNGAVWRRAAYLHEETRLGWHVCMIWAKWIGWKYKLINGEK